MKSMAERRLEATTWGVLFVWLGVMMMIQEPVGLTGVGAGSILLLSALIQKAVGWEAGAVMWVAGIALLLSGLNELVGDRDVPVAAVILIIIGLLIVLRAVTGGPRARRHSGPWAAIDPLQAGKRRKGARGDGGDVIDV